MREDADKLYPDIIESLKVALDSEVTKWGDCPKCGKRVAVAFPDLHGRAKAIQLLIEQGYGKPTETIEVSAIMEAELECAHYTATTGNGSHDLLERYRAVASVWTFQTREKTLAEALADRTRPSVDPRGDDPPSEFGPRAASDDIPF